MAAALGGATALPQLRGDMWGEGGGLIAELRLHLLLCHYPSRRFVPPGSGHSQTPGEDRDKQSLMVPPGLSLGSQSPGLASAPEMIQAKGSPSSPSSSSHSLSILWPLPEPLSPAALFQVCITYETVPCRALGMVLRYVDGRVFVTEVLPESQADVDEVVLAGDILDEINGCSLRNAYSGQARAVLQKMKGQPLSFRLLRWRWHDGEVYEPLLPYLKVLKEKEPHFQLQR
uniref:PDZ domain-containing protein n=1 Tax=Bubo bubo TaxID=30461 RepID=A0A8C0EAI3_BUBBB